MLRANLATRPFYNERAALLVLTAIGVIVLLATAFNVQRLMALTSKNQELAARISAADDKTRDLRDSAARLRGSIDPRELASVANAAREANAIIGQRTFSWTDLFNRFETTLPPDVRIVKVSPAVDDRGEMIVTIGVIARRVEDINTFIERLEGTGTFASLLPRRQSTNEEGLIEETLEGRYEPGRTPGKRGPA